MPPIVNEGDWGYIVRELEAIIVLVFLTRIQFHSPKVAPLINSAEVAV